jgi:hypothetical protein
MYNQMPSEQQVYGNLLASILCQSVKAVSKRGGLYLTSKDRANSMKLETKNYK